MQKRIFKRRLTIKSAALVASLHTLLISNAFAVAPGFYMGMAVGPATNGGGNIPAQLNQIPPPTTSAAIDFVVAKPKSTQFGTRLFAGYKNNQYIGSEYGFNYFSEVSYDTSGRRNNPANLNNPCSGTNIRTYDFDVVIKGSVPVRSFEVFGKAGVAMMYQNTAGTFNLTTAKPTDSTTQPVCGASKNTFKFVPTFSAGASYDLSQNWVVDAAWTHTAVSGKLSSIDMYGLGISYHFVDTYCGQFLC